MLAVGREAAHGIERPAGEGAPTFYSTEQAQPDKYGVEPRITGVPHMNFRQS